jgi:Tripartite tricarboxylate transporter TctB family
MGRLTDPNRGFRFFAPCATTGARNNKSMPHPAPRRPEGEAVRFMSRVKDQKDFWSGILFIAFGCAGLWLGRNYPLGTLVHMGPGFFPMMMSVALIGIGGFLVARSLIVAGEPVERTAFWPQLLILGAIVAFGLLIERIGLAVAVIAVAAVSGIAAQGLRWFELVALCLAMSALSVALFIYLLGQPIPVWVQ